MRRRGQPSASSTCGNVRRPIGGEGERSEQLAHEIAAAVVEAGDLVGIVHRVLGRVLGKVGETGVRPGGELFFRPRV